MQELRKISIDNFEVRKVTEDNFIGEISGYAIVFNQPSEDMGFIEYVDSHALDNTDLSDVLALFNHDFGEVIGRTPNTLNLKIDKKGLLFNLKLADTTTSRDVYENIKAGNLKGLSFGFTVSQDDWKDNGKTRIIKDIDRLFEISVVAIPAYSETELSVTRSLKKNDSTKQKLLLELDLY